MRIRCLSVFGSHNDYDETLRGLKSARSELEAAEAKARIAKEQLDYTQLTSESIRLPRGVTNCWIGILKSNGCAVKAADAIALKKTPQIIERLQDIMKYDTAGDPKTGLKWTRKATRKVATALQQEGIMVSDKSVARLLKKMGYSLRANRKKLALSGNGSKHERRQRDLQFRHICTTRECFARRGEPNISVDTKKKELIGNFKNPGRVWRDRDRPVADHDFPSYAKVKISPYGIYDPIANKAMVCVGISHDTPAFAADSIAKWWELHGAKQYPKAKRLLILADNGGSNRPTSVCLKYHLWSSLCLQHGLKVPLPNRRIQMESHRTPSLFRNFKELGW